MYKVYWTNELNVVESADFADNEMTTALECVRYCRDVMNYTFVTMVSGNVPGQVGKAGVTPAPADYAWTKRRHNERGEGGVIRKYLKLTDEVEVPMDEE